MINVQELNSLTDIFDYNCGGFALHVGDWYAPARYDEGQETIKEMLEQCVEDIMDDFPELSRVSDYSGVPDEMDVVGFRLCVASTYKVEYDEQDNEVETDIIIDEVRDFHFILRSEGIWYHKPGSTKVREVDFDIDDEWPHNEYNYNSDIVWFARPHEEIVPEDFGFLMPENRQEEEEAE